ncbi:MAG: GNAT family N-acetyltransferase [Bacteroidota bacterium]
MSVRFAPLSDVRADALALWERAAVRTPFAHPDVVQATGEAFGLTPIAALGDRVGLIGLEKTRGLVRALSLPPATAYTAPLLAEWPREADTVSRATELDDFAGALTRHFAQATLSLPPEWPDARPFAWNGWTLATRYTASVDLREDPVSEMSHGTRQPARRHADVYEVHEGAREVGPAARFQVKSYARKHLSLGIAPETLHRLGDAMYASGLARAFGAYRDGTCEAAALFTVDGPRAIYWLSGSEPGPGMGVLFLHAMQALADSGVETLDLGGANVPGVAQFKRQLGGVLTPVVVARWVGPRWLRALHAVRS